MKIVPFGPITMVRAPGWPLRPDLGLEAGRQLQLVDRKLVRRGVTIGGVGCGLRLASCLLAAGFDLSSGLKPGGACAAAEQAKRPAIAPASSRRRRIASM